MASDEGESSAVGPSASKRRRPITPRSNNACDLCRKRKIRCDGKQFNTGKCTNCRDHNRECTFTISTKKYPPGYVIALETKVERLEGLIQRLLPGQDFTQEVGFKLTKDNWMLPGVCGAPGPQDPSMFLAVPATTTGHSDSVVSSSVSVMGSGNSVPTTPQLDDLHESDDDTRERTTKLQNLRSATALSAKSNLLASYLGRSSATELVRKAFEMRTALAPHIQTSTILRPQLWKRPAWLLAFESAHPPQPLVFPDQDLLEELVEHYFSYVNILTPVLHRPTFEYGLRSSLHVRERNFGCVVLLVCALGSRFSNDRRVTVDGDRNWHSAGWDWYMQTRIFDDTTLLSTTSHLHVLQAACLATLYASDVSSIHACMLVSFGIRFAIDIGAHKRRAYGPKPTLEDELYKRSFWALVHFDRTLSAGMGRPRSIQEEDFDLEMPLCCDDEDLTRENPEWFSNQPSVISYFIWMLRLSQIQGLALRTVYASAKARVHYNFQGDEWMTQTVAHLDSLLNNWVDSVPDHLRWDPTRANEVFFSQSAHLHLQYRSLQILLHRPSIAVRGLKPLPALPLMICTSAARSITRVADALNKRKPHHLGVSDTVLMWTLGIPAIVILVGIADARLSSTSIDRKQAMEDVELLLSMLRVREERWATAGRQVDVLEAFRSLGEPSDEPQPGKQRKRSRNSEPPYSVHEQSNAMAESSSTSHLQSTVRDAPSINPNEPVLPGRNVTEDSEANGTDYPLNELPSQSAGSVLGSVDFGALFGLGDTSSDGPRPWSPAPHADTLDSFSMGPFLGSGDSVDIRPEEWTGMTFDLGTDDWYQQWTAPSRQTPWNGGNAGGSSFPQQ